MAEESTTIGDGMSITEAIIEVMCKVEEIEPEEFDYVLYDWIDPDALTKLFANPPGGRSVAVEFSLSDFRITVRNDSLRDDRTVTVRKAPREATVTGAKREGVR